MLLGIMSDTHDHLDNTRRASELLVDAGVDMVLHLGDIVSPFTLRLLASVLDKPLVGVFGNNDGDKLLLYRIASDKGWRLAEAPLIMELEGRRLLLLHGWGPAENTVGLVEALAYSKSFDAILYGHTHKVDHRRMDGTLVLNPGAVSGYLAEKPSLALLNLESMEAEIKYLE